MRQGLLALLMALLTGCAFFGPKQTVLEMNISAGPALNPSVQGRASPVVVRVFELKNPATFEDADFMSLYEHEREVLAADLVARDELVITPGEKRRIERVLQEETKLLGIVVAFRALERATWRTSIAIRTNKKNKITLTMDDVVVSAAPAK